MLAQYMKYKKNYCGIWCLGHEIPVNTDKIRKLTVLKVLAPGMPGLLSGIILEFKNYLTLLLRRQKITSVLLGSLNDPRMYISHQSRRIHHATFAVPESIFGTVAK